VRTMRTFPAAVLGLLLIGACAPTVPDSGNGVGFEDYSTYELRRAQADAAAAGRTQGLDPRISDEVVTGAPQTALASALPPAGAVSGAPLPGAPAGDEAASLAAQTVAALQPAGTVGVAPAAPLPAAPVPAAPLPLPADVASADPATPTGMSDEQDFAAVSARESIQSDAERLAQARAQYQEVAPAPLPQRTGASDTVVIDFALATTNTVGQKRFDRGGRVSQERFYRACAKYGAQDAAQEDFLDSGGPERDPKYLDPDGDGFACFWDPSPFRLARQGAVAAPVAREVVPGDG
jgi:hypothetical protein